MGRALLTSRAPLVQRQRDGSDSPGTPDAPAPAPALTSTCPSWYQDPQSLSKVAAQKYVADILHRPAPPPSTTACEPPRPDGVYRCIVRFQTTRLLPEALQPPASVKVFVFPDKLAVTGEPFISTEGTAAIPLCFFDYTCSDRNQLVLTLRECRRGPAPAPPTP